MGKRAIFLAWAALSALGVGLVWSSDSVLGFVIALCCIASRLVCYILAAIDAYRSAKRINKQAAIDAYAALQTDK